MLDESSSQVKLSRERSMKCSKNREGLETSSEDDSDGRTGDQLQVQGL